MANYESAYQASLTFFEGDDLAAKTFVDKYALQDDAGDFKELTPNDTHRRLAKELSRIENKYPNPMSDEEIYFLLQGFRWVVLQGSPMSAIGNPYQLQSAGNCFVVQPPFDSYGGIMKADQELAQLMKRRAGVGVDVSNIRPRGVLTKNAAKTTDGIGVFMERFSNTCREVAQNGRRGAEMQTISVAHPEIRTFINIKKDRTKVTGANVSIRVTDEFMNAVQKKEKFKLRWPVDSDAPIVEEWVDAKELWDEIILAAWESAEPGVLFWDTILRYSPADIYALKYPAFRTYSTNPCGELPLGLDSCRLALMNLLSFVEEPFTKKARFNFELFDKMSQKGQRLMDDVIDLELELIDRILEKIEADNEPADVKATERNLWLQYRTTCEQGRRTGLGITALGDCIAALGIRYGSEKSIELTEAVYRQLAVSSYKSSCAMAGERGPFPIFDAALEKGHPFIERMLETDPELKRLYKKHGRRNVANLTTAPAGSMSILTKTTSGIEPAYLVAYTRRKKINPSDVDAKVDFIDHMGDKWQEFKVYHHGFKKWMDVTGGSEVEKSPYHKATSNDVDWEASVAIQAGAQKWIDHSISKTCNLPNDVTPELVSKIYLEAWKQGCKGFTIYRDGCRTGVLVSTSKDSDGRPNRIKRNHAPKRPNVLPCDIYHGKVQGEPWVVIVGILKDEPYEIFAGPNKDLVPKSVKNGFVSKIKLNKTDNRYDLNVNDKVVEDIGNQLFENKMDGAFSRTLSLALRHGAPVQHLVEQLGKNEAEELNSLTSVLRRALKKYIADGTIASGAQKGCEKCGSHNLRYQEGCPVCTDCGFTKCK